MVRDVFFVLLGAFLAYLGWWCIRTFVAERKMKRDGVPATAVVVRVGYDTDDDGDKHWIVAEFTTADGIEVVTGRLSVHSAREVGDTEDVIYLPTTPATVSVVANRDQVTAVVLMLVMMPVCLVAGLGMFGIGLAGLLG
ncbi:MAG: hypothetical protein HOV66_22455 [Streptomycetaceae bacterium]|jgi:hypothetical protein|nr:hypothetical protein [Streptomycetaceae bacterium]NUR29500.1 hypothetical protein [Catenulispora sp.]NUS57593.1 hypothetical protein [Streptomycetaceae bacterium]